MKQKQKVGSNSLPLAEQRLSSQKVLKHQVSLPRRPQKKMRPVSFREMESLSFSRNLSHITNNQQQGRASAVLQQRSIHVPEDIQALDTLRMMTFEHRHSQQVLLGASQDSSGRRRGRDGRPSANPGHNEQAATYEELLALDERNVSKGINTTVQRKVLKERKVTTSDDSACVVCQEEFTKGETAMFLPCGHCFHFPCISPWLAKDRTCPTCRKEVYHTAVP